MKKFITTASVVLTLAGCTASVSIADVQNSIATTSNTVKETNASKPGSLAQSLIQEAKSKRNAVKMKQVIKYLKTRVERTSYVFSGSSPRGWDCSGMVRWAYARFGLDIPHSANKQAHLGTRVSSPAIGDIVVFAYQGSTSFYHAAMYIGNGKIVHANRARKTTVIEPLSNYKSSQIRFVRLVNQVS